MPMRRIEARCGLTVDGIRMRSSISHFVSQLAPLYGIRVISVIRNRSTADELERTKRSAVRDAAMFRASESSETESIAKTILFPAKASVERRRKETSVSSCGSVILRSNPSG
jgi:hypothetical protein